MSSGVITIFGGTGFLGRRITLQALDAGWKVRVCARRTRTDLFVDQAVQPEQITVDIRDAEAVNDTANGATGMVNAVGLYVENRLDSFEAVHVTGADNVARAAAVNNAGLVHVSGIGADPASRSAYVRARAAGEERVRSACPHGVILRPSVLFGPDDAFLSAMLGLIKWLPVIPLFGNGSTRLQPVHVDDVACAVLKALGRGDARGRTFELGGSEILDYREFVRKLAACLGRRPALVPLPFALWNMLAAMATVLPNPPLTRDQVELMRRDNVVLQASTFEDLGVEADSLRRIWDVVNSELR